ncbi:purine and uridine phosphorylase [Aspergillus pseudodeflectus]|uniref:Purine and uridine phosphorylase n=1 Tax=Aspergillus pseudodeflectus TaxID=176178 RepID=A0ABR4LBH8_9EURO
MSDTEQYTVGWICALETEYIAARAFLEKKHDRPETLSRNDNNHYTLGEIGGHHVVIAVLLKGECGTSSAASVARDMVHSFPNFRFGLMVGIGGGAPSTKHDIRLGDIVVSSPRNGRGGLIQYDFGKDFQGKDFQQTGFLNQPPPILRTAVAGLKARYMEEGNQLKESIQAVLEGNERLERKYAPPPPEADKLYESSFVHPNPQEECGKVCDNSKVIQRPPRTDEDDDPAIHYGLIASGNRAINNAMFRDKVVAEQDVLGFKMEAAGLMNHFPCLVIHGICDYADSHENKEWQGYAAMAAAAYARDLLREIVPRRVYSERRAIEVIEEMRTSLDNVSGNIDNIHSITTALAKKIEGVVQSIDLKELPFAEGAEFGTYMDQHEDDCLPGTRENVLHEVEDWATLPEGKCMFWLNGLAGTGKSTIARTMASMFQQRGLLGASFFFKRGKGDCGRATRFYPTIARELFNKVPELRASILQVIQDDPRISMRPFKEQFEQLIQQPLDKLCQAKQLISPLVIVIDAIDECENENDIRVILQQLPRAVSLRFFITSRPELAVRLGFHAVENSYQELILHEIPGSVIENDISLFLKHKLVEISKQRGLCLDWPREPHFRALLSQSIPLFIFAATVCRLFEDYNLDPEQCLTEILDNQNEESKLEQTYLPVLNRALSAYDGKRKIQLIRDVREVLGTIILLQNPLSIISLSSLMGITTSSIRARISSLHSVLNIPNDHTLPVMIFHSSFRDFLLDPYTREKTHLWVDKEETNAKLSNYCLSVMRNRLKRNICNLPSHGTQRKDLHAELINDKLPSELQYACRYWIHHTAQSKDSILQVDDVFAFLQVHFLHWVEVMSILGFVSEVIVGITSLKSVLPGDKNPKISEFLDDAKRLIRTVFERAIPSWIHQWPRVDDENWGSDWQTLRGHSDKVFSIAFSPNSKLLASVCCDGTIKLWDVLTGELKHTLEDFVASPTGPWRTTHVTKISP